jgi:aminopeptidase N
MGKRWIYFVIAVLVGIAISIAVTYSTNDLNQGKPVFLRLNQQRINWEDREVYRSGLHEEAQHILDDLPQASVYHIFLDIPQDLGAAIQGHQLVRYYNTEDEVLDDLVLRLFPNLSEEHLQINTLQIDGVEVQYSLENENTTARITLDQALKPGDSVLMEIEFTISPSSVSMDDYEQFGYYDDVLMLDLAYPLIPAYDNQGWSSKKPDPTGDLPYMDISFYLVEVQAPRDLVLGTSGQQIRKMVTADRQALLFVAGPSRDFYLVGSKDFEILIGERNQTLVSVMTYKENADLQDFSLEVAYNTLEILSDTIGPYPYKELDIITTPMNLLMGMEYPGLVTIDSYLLFSSGGSFGQTNQEILESILSHEIIHQWFYHMVGSDQQNAPWVDEALTEYLTYVYILKAHGPEEAKSKVNQWYSAWGWVGTRDIPIGKPIGEYSDFSYGGIVFGRGPLFYYHLEEKLGLDVLLDGIRLYYQENLWELGTGQDIRDALEETCSCDLSAEFEEWVYWE